ncbi:nucleotide-binding protein [Actinomycetes bacterium]|nr:nucleotide-binding protein [Actinomycetes bacterium]
MVSSDVAPFDVVLVTGMSGAGRSTAAHVLEDIGWFVIDNLPPSMLQQAIELVRGSEDISKVAVVVDVRGKSFFRDLNRTLEALGRDGVPVRTLFLESSDESLVRRFESSRRPHPLQGSQRITDGLAAERIALGDMRAIADVVIDTTALNVHDLRRKIEAAFGHEDALTLHATVMSFGFKYGIPVDADLVADVRFLPNPHWIPELKDLNGLDEPVMRTVLTEPAAQAFLQIYSQMINVIAPGYVEEGKRYATIAVGCTGGKHRSVAVSEELASRLRAAGIETLVVHRDLGRE